MLKKKNIAMVMAAATVATSVAPVFALEAQNVDEKTLVSEVQAKLAVKYSDAKVDGETSNAVPVGEEYKNSVYKITANGTEVKSVEHLKTLIEKAEIKGETINVVITDKGHATVDGKIVATTKEGKKYSNQAELDAQFAEVNKVLEAKAGDAVKYTNGKSAGEKVEIATATLEFDKATTGNKISKVTLTPEGGLAKFTQPVVLQANSNKIDTSVIMVNGAEKAIGEVATVDKAEVTGFKQVAGTYTAEDLNAQFANLAKFKDMVNGNTAKLQSKSGIEVGTVKAVTEGVALKYEISLVGDADEKVTVKAADAKIDLATGVDKDGNEINISEIRDEATAKRVAGFKLVKGTDTVDLASKVVSRLTYGAHVMAKYDYNLSTFKTDKGYTDQGKELVSLLNLASDAGKKVTATKDGKVYQVRFNKVSKDNLNIDAVKEGGYKLNIDLKVVENGKDLPAKENVQLVVKSNVQADLAALKDVIVKGTDISTAKYETIAGETRFETAIEISKKAHAAKTNKVVLVGENAIVDGLASAPLAKKANAPILLTKKDSIPESTMKEIKRLTNKGDKVYLVGGENTISKAVEAQLAKEMNAEIVRVAGNDRYETSLKIAEELDVVNGGANFTQAFVVGGDGLADAMSIAAVASKDTEESPIIVTPSTGLTKDAKAFLKARATITKADVVGGTTKVTTQVLKDLVATNINADNVRRIAGVDRNDTNAKVIETYFTGSKLAKAYVAKDGDAQLVDALAAAPLAGKNNGAIVLATNDLTKAQADKLEANKAVGNKEVTQIGNGVASSVVQKVLKALGL